MDNYVCAHATFFQKEIKLRFKKNTNLKMYMIHVWTKE